MRGADVIEAEDRLQQIPGCSLIPASGLLLFIRTELKSGFAMGAEAHGAHPLIPKA